MTVYIATRPRISMEMALDRSTLLWTAGQFPDHLHLPKSRARVATPLQGRLTGLLFLNLKRRTSCLKRLMEVAQLPPPRILRIARQTYRLSLRWIILGSTAHIPRCRQIRRFGTQPGEMRPFIPSWLSRGGPCRWMDAPYLPCKTLATAAHSQQETINLDQFLSVQLSSGREVKADRLCSLVRFVEPDRATAIPPAASSGPVLVCLLAVILRIPCVRQ